MTNFRKIITNEVDSFIHLVSPDTTVKVYQYYVFVLKLNKVDQKELDFTLGYIINQADYKLIQAEYVFYHKKNIILVNKSKSLILATKTLKDLRIKNIVKTDSFRIFNKLLSPDEGIVTYTAEGLTFNKKGNNIIKTFYERGDFIPREENIYLNVPNFNVKRIDW